MSEILHQSQKLSLSESQVSTSVTQKGLYLSLHGFVSPGGTSQDLSRLLLNRQQEKDEKGKGEGGVDEHSLQAGKGRGQRASAEPP
ncbi:unnamed protein product [Rangifer tarandus platyrhynchus]|uniref:Uncharacterized protein n=1 Tax=Rangifer tarandus platyrhynchus TaxID=3082113 RepID=A0ABN8Y408_RANTA|nr:unnamed protein product [Rangifer tarandus platyrhynchus]